MTGKWPCRKDGEDCPRREPGCQDRCAEMLAAKLAAEEEKRAIRARRDADNAVDSVKVHAHEIRMRRKSGQR